MRLWTTTPMSQSVDQRYTPLFSSLSHHYARLDLNRQASRPDSFIFYRRNENNTICTNQCDKEQGNSPSIFTFQRCKREHPKYLRYSIQSRIVANFLAVKKHTFHTRLKLYIRSTLPWRCFDYVLCTNFIHIHATTRSLPQTKQRPKYFDVENWKKTKF